MKKKKKRSQRAGEMKREELAEQGFSGTNKHAIQHSDQLTMQNIFILTKHNSQRFTHMNEHMLHIGHFLKYAKI